MARTPPSARGGRGGRIHDNPPDSTTATYLSLTQWLDDDRFVLFAYTGDATESADEGDVFTCALSSDTCRLELQGEPVTRCPVSTDARERRK